MKRYTLLLIGVLLALVLALVGGAAAQAVGPGGGPTSVMTAPPTLNVRAYIDGRSHLIVRGEEIYWHHYDFAAPGRHSDAPGGNVPTYLNEAPWYPTWPGDPPDHDPADPIDNEVRDCDCRTLDAYAIAPPLPLETAMVAVSPIHARGPVTVIQQPNALNDYTLIVEFNDNAPSGAAWYNVTLAYYDAVYQPTNDAYVMASRPKSVFGAKPVLRVKDAAKDVNTYVKFNVSGLSGTVQSATLRLWVNDPGPDGGAVYAVSPFYAGTTELWVETGLRWNNAPTISGAPLDSVGNAVKGQWVELDVTSAVVAALGDNGRVSLAIANDSRNLVAYSSKEGAHPPELVVVTN